MSQKLFEAIQMVTKAMRATLTESLQIDISEGMLTEKHIIRWQDCDGNERKQTVHEFAAMFRDQLSPLDMQA